MYLLTYPVLQWGVGGWLLAPVAEAHPLLDNGDSTNAARTSSFENHVLAQFSDDENDTRTDKLLDPNNSKPKGKFDVKKSVLAILKKVLQPPVIASMLGLFIAAIHQVRGLFVDLTDRDNDAPLEWFFNGLNTVGDAAVPINMFILGSSLYYSAKGVGTSVLEDEKLQMRTMLAIIFGKLVIMPAIGIGTAMLMRQFLSIPEDIDASFYLVIMLVTATPTANNVMVMAELGGQSKEAMAMSIFSQYLCAPIVLTASVGVIVTIASKW